MTDNQSRKAQLRASFRRRRRAVDANERAIASTAIAERLDELLPDVQRLGGFAAHDNEIDLRAFYETWLASGRTLVLPRVVAQGEMVFADVPNLAALSPGRFGIAEPDGPAVDLASVDAFLVPAVAFDRAGSRLGFGGGYYDRALHPLVHNHEQVPIVLGIGYSWQLLDDELPFDSWDVRIPCIVTDAEVWRVPTNDSHP